ncbi:MAG TPA: AAA family ATPase [Steroidobacteraceae bacterium]|jgi:WD40 repeat protein|nr:AAA family ATPase [Steroidobacteraceae bacterium]
MNDEVLPPGKLSPYPGLRPFDTDEAEIFFGREEQTDQILNRLSRTRFLAIVGPSGCGKSSLVRAGMIVALQSGLMSAAGSRWRIAQMRPGERPLWRLAQALAEPAALDLEGKGGSTALAFADATLRRGPLGLIELLQERWLPGDTSLLLLIDQFEEIFRYRREQSAAEADAFVALLLATAAQREFPVYVVLTMRSDFLGECQLFRGLPEAINEGQYLTPRMTREQIRSAIIGPARIVGADVDPDLATQLLNEVGSDPDQLPLLQHALMRMWQHMQERTDPAAERRSLSLADYAAVGSIANALSSHANQVYKSLSDSQRQIAEVMFRRLTHRSTGKRDTRRPASLGDISGAAAAAATDVIGVVDEFRHPERSFVTPPAGVPLSAETTLDIGHESLIRQWNLLNRWVDWETKSAETYFRLKDSAAREQQGRAALWRSPDLDDGLKWLEDENPNEAWAKRYGTPEDFQRAMDFLERSKQQQRAEQEAALELERRSRAEREQRLLDQARAGRKFFWLSVALGIIAVFAVALAYFASESRQIAEERRRMSLARQLNTQAEAALENELDYDGEGPRQAILLSMHSLREGWTPEAYEILARNIDLLSSAKVATIPGHAGAVQFMLSSDNARWLVSEDKGEILVWDWPTRKIVKRFAREPTDSFDAVRFSPDNRWLALGKGSNTEIHDTASWQTPPVMLAYGTIVRSLAFSPDGATLVIASDAAADVLVVDTSTWKESGRIEGDKGTDLLAVAFSSDGQWLAVSDNTFRGDGDITRLRLWEMKTRRMVGRVDFDRVDSIEFSPDGRALKLGRWNKPCRLYRVNSQYGGGLTFDDDTKLDKFCFRSTWSSSFSADGRYFVVVNADGSAGMIDVDHKLEVRRVMQGVSAAALTPDGRWLIAGGSDGALSQFDYQSNETRRIPGVPGTISLAFSPNGRWLAAVGTDGLVRMFDQQGWRLLTSIPLGDQSNENTRAWFSDDSSWLVLLDNRSLRVIATSDWKNRLNAPYENNFRLAGFSPDGRRLFVTVDRELYVADVANWHTVGPLRQEGVIKEVVASPDGKLLATLTLPDYVSGYELQSASITTVWDADTGAELGWLSHEAEDFKSIGHAVRAPGAAGRWTKTESGGDVSLAREASRWPVVLSKDQPPKIGHEAWLVAKTAKGVETFKPILGRAHNAHVGRILDYQTSSDGEWLATAGDDGTTRLWRISPAGLIDEACKRVGRELTAKEWQAFAGDEPYEPVCPPRADAPAKQSATR